MGNCESSCSSCCKGVFFFSSQTPSLLMFYVGSDSLNLAGRSRDGGLYEPVLQDSEREAVSDLLQFLENARPHLTFLFLFFSFSTLFFSFFSNLLRSS